MLDTRAVLRLTPAGIDEACPGCNERIRWHSQRRRAKLVLCNVYKGRGAKRRWNRVEYWHLSCYEAADCPHGLPVNDKEI